MRVTSLHLYPVKSCRGIPVAAAVLTPRGFDGDRRWMVVDGDGRFLSQRELPQMTLIRCALDAGAIELSAPGATTIEIPRLLDAGERVEVGIWSARVDALVHDGASAWLSRVLGRPCRAVYMPEDVRRAVSRGESGDVVSFADAFPYLLASETSLAELARRMDAPIAMERFRPNIVIDGDAPFGEDAWPRVRIGAAVFRAPKGCDRCAVTTVDPATGATGHEPLRTLATFRKRDGQVWFGVNLVPDGDSDGVLRVGDPVEPL